MANKTFSNDSAKVTVKQLDTVVSAMAGANDERFTKKADTGAMAAKDEVTKAELGANLKNEIEGKANSANTLSGYGITDAYTKTEIDGKMSSAYKAGGSKTAAEITDALLVAANEGKVYNVSDELTTTADFVEGAGKKHPAGTNVAVIEATPADGETPATYKFDVMAGFVDLSDYAKNDDVAVATQADIQKIVDGLYASDDSGSEENNGNE